MLRIGICDDTAAARENLRLLCLKHFRLEEPEFFEFSTGDGAVRWLKGHPGALDLLFLDIEMPGRSGMEAAETIRAFDREVLLAFVTSYTDYVYDGYAVGAMGYLVKPVSEEKLSSLLDRAAVALEQRAPAVYTLRNAQGMFKIPLREILYAASDRRQVTLTTSRGDYTFYGKLDDVAAQLGAGFVRIHQRYLVNARAVSAVVGASVQVGEARLPISRSLHQQAAMALARAMVGEG